MKNTLFPKECLIKLDEVGEIQQIITDESDFLSLNLEEFKGTLLTDWVFEPQKKIIEDFFQYCIKNPDNINSKNHIGIWFNNKRNKYFWCIITKSQKIPDPEKYTFTLYDYTELLPKSTDILTQNPLLYDFFQKINIPIGITNIAGYWIEANPALCSLFGYKKNELLKLTWQELTCTENLDQELTLFQEAIKKPTLLFNKVITFQKLYLKKDRSPFQALVNLFPISGDEAESIYGFLVHIENLDEKERKTKEAEQARNLIKIIMDLLPVRVFWKDTGLHYLGCNLAFAKDAGKNSPDEVIGTTDYQLPWKSEAELYRKDDQKVITSGKSKMFYEEPQTTPDGQQIWLRTSKIPLMGPRDIPYGVLGIYEDITDLKSLINTLNETMSLLKTLIDSAPIGIIAFNKEENIEFWNKVSEDILKWKIDEVLSKPIHRFIPAISNHISKCKDTHPSSEIEIEEKDKFGNYLNLRLIHRLIHFTNRSPLYLLLFRDISEIKKFEKEKEQLQEQLQHTQKLESLGILSSSIAHDFNNILMAVMGYSELAKEEINNPYTIKNYLLNIEEAIKSAGELCRQLLIFAGKKQQPHQPCNLNQLILEMEHLLKVSISKKIVLQIDIENHLPFIDGETNQLRSIILNLVINASDAIENRSGVICIRTGTIDFTESFIRTTWFQEKIEAKKYVFLEVSDNGCGMSPETMSKIFDPFFTTKEYGRGLGLSTIMGILRAHHGTIKVYSEVGKGTTFKLFFPTTTDIHEKQQEVEDTTPWKGKGLILLADDEPVVLQVTAKMLEKLGLDVITAKDGREALQLFEKYQKELSAVILDITMPHLDGIDTARIIRSKLPDLPIFLSSGFSKHSVNKNDVDFFIQGFLSKPYNINTIIKSLKKYF